MRNNIIRSDFGKTIRDHNRRVQDNADFYSYLQQQCAEHGRETVASEIGDLADDLGRLIELLEEAGQVVPELTGQQLPAVLALMGRPDDASWAAVYLAGVALDEGGIEPTSKLLAAKAESYFRGGKPPEEQV